MAYKINDPWLILQASTGFGKSTSFIYFLLSQMRYNVVVFVPRVSIAMSVARYVEITFPNLKLGENLGYITGSGSIRPRSPKSITFVTVQLLPNFIEGDKIHSQDTVFVVDEVHEWHTNTAINWALYLMREQQMHRELQTRVIFMSATPQTDIINNYLLHSPKNTPYIQIARKQDSVVEEFMDVKREEAFDRFVNYIKTKKFKKVMIFHIGLQMKQRDHVMIGGHKYGIYKVDRATINKDPDVLQYYSKLSRGIFLSTPMGDIGITIEGIDCVINTGLTYTNIYCPLISARVLVVSPSNMPTDVQRTGRAGRTGPGESVHANIIGVPLKVGHYTRESENKWEEDTAPKMTVDPSYVDCLQLFNSPGTHVVLPTANIYEEHIHGLETAGILDIDPVAIGTIITVLQQNKIDLEDFAMFLVCLSVGFNSLDAAMLTTYARWDFKSKDLKVLEVITTNGAASKEINILLDFVNDRLNVAELNPKLRSLLYEIKFEAKLCKIIFNVFTGGIPEPTDKRSNLDKLAAMLKTYYPGRMFKHKNGKIFRPGYGTLQFGRISLEPNTSVHYLSMQYNHIRGTLFPLLSIKSKI